MIRGNPSPNRSGNYGRSGKTQLACCAEYIQNLVPLESEINNDVFVKYSGSNSVDQQLQIELKSDFEFEKKTETLVIKPFEFFADRRGGKIRNEVIDALSKRGVSRMKDVQYVVYRLLFPQYASPYKEADFVIFSPTGSGKTLAYAIPLMQACLQFRGRAKRKPIAIIFCLTTTLVDAVKKLFLELIGDLDIRVTTAADEKTNGSSHGEYDVGIFTYRTFEMLYAASFLGLEDLQFIVIDDADSFVEDYQASRFLLRVKKYSKARVLQFSATGNEYMREVVNNENVFAVICGELNIVPDTIKQSFIEVNILTAPTIVGFGEENIRLIPGSEIVCPFDQLINVLQGIEYPQKVLIFVKRKAVAVFLANRLAFFQFRVFALSSDYRMNDRQAILDGFQEGKFNIMVTTGFVSRGMDFDIDFVINYDLPLTYVEYVHRCGRVGRNGKPGRSITFMDHYASDDYDRKLIEILLRKCKDMVQRGILTLEELPRIFQEEIVKLMAYDAEVVEDVQE